MEFRRSSITTTVSASASASSTFYREFRMPSIATGPFMGQKGRIIERLQNTAGISSIKLSSGRAEIRGESVKAVQGVVKAIERLLCNKSVRHIRMPIVSTSKEYHPHFFIICFCKSLADPLLAVSKIFLEKFTGEICSSHRVGDRSYFCVKTGAICDQVSGLGSSIAKLSNMDSLSAQFCRKRGISESIFFSYWDFSAYKTTLLSCLKFLRLENKYKTIKLVIRFGKLLFDIGPNLSKSLENGDFVSLSRLLQLYIQRKLNSFFSMACSDAAVRDVKLHLERLQYVKISSGKKISISVADLVEGQLQRYNVSVHCETSMEGHNVSSSDKSESPTGAVITRVRRLRARHGFITFSTEGHTTSDFRLEVVTQEMDHLNNIDILPEIVEWVEQAWRDRTPDQLLVFPPPERFLIMSIRHKNTETYCTEDFKFRISEVTGGNGINMMANKEWECKLSSRWFESSYGVPGAHTADSSCEDIDSAVETDVGSSREDVVSAAETDADSKWEDVESAVETGMLALINEAVKFSEVIPPST